LPHRAAGQIRVDGGGAKFEATVEATTETFGAAEDFSAFIRACVVGFA
jgi:hypothetical protein